jgi:hypothetical protein
MDRTPTGQPACQDIAPRRRMNYAETARNVSNRRRAAGQHHAPRDRRRQIKPARPRARCALLLDCRHCGANRPETGAD